MKFNEKLLDLRKQKGWSQEELGFKLNVTRQTVSKWELGETSPKLEELQALSELFDISIDELTGKEKQTIEITNRENKKKSMLKIIIKWLIFIILSIYLGYSIYKYLIINEFLKRLEETNEAFGMNYGIIEIKSESGDIKSWNIYVNDNGTTKVFNEIENYMKVEEHIYDGEKCTKSICYDYNLKDRTYTKKEYEEYHTDIFEQEDFESDEELLKEIRKNIVNDGLFSKIALSINPMSFVAIRDIQIEITKGIFEKSNNHYTVNITEEDLNKNNGMQIMYSRRNIDKANKAKDETVLIEKVTTESLKEIFDAEMGMCNLVEQ